MTIAALAARLLIALALTVALPVTGRADMLDNAQNYLSAVGVPVPAGFTVRWGSDTAGGASGEVKPNNPNDMSQGGVIVINPEGIKVMAPSLSGDVTQFGGILVVTLYHELKHADGSYGSDICSEIRLQNHAAQKACELVLHILGEIPTANVTPLCTHYRDVQKRYNLGVTTPGGAAGAWAAAGCSGSFPGAIPSCAGCP